MTKQNFMIFNNFITSNCLNPGRSACYAPITMRPSHWIFAELWAEDCWKKAGLSYM